MDVTVQSSQPPFLGQVIFQCVVTSTWTRTTFDLTPFAGQSVTLQFLQHGLVPNANFSIDDVVVFNNGG
jgi:hypothetical protein